MGPAAPSVPTLLRVTEDARAWTGPAMGVRLARLLGVRSTTRVLGALGELKRGEGAGRQFGRQQFLRFGAGAVVAGGLILTGKAPAFGSQSRSELDTWLTANKNNLPTRYSEVVKYPMAYRRAIFVASSPETKRGLWADHLKSCRALHPALGAKQAEVVSLATALVGDRSLFAGTGEPAAAMDGRLEALKSAAAEAFGIDEARSLIATLGPAQVMGPKVRGTVYVPQTPTGAAILSVVRVGAAAIRSAAAGRFTGTTAMECAAINARLPGGR
jgi:hypothetical protein